MSDDSRALVCISPSGAGSRLPALLAPNFFRVVSSDSLLSRLRGYTMRHLSFVSFCFCAGFIAAVMIVPRPHSTHRGVSLRELSREIAEETTRVEASMNVSTDVSADAAALGESRGTDEVRTKVKFLASEYARLKKYEDQLKRRADSLDAILTEAERLIGSAVPIGDTGVSSPTRFRRRGLGLGGGDVSKAPIIHLGSVPSENAPADTPVLKAAESRNRVSMLLNDLDRQMARLSATPIGSPIDAEITSGFGTRSSPFSGRAQVHQGVDFSIDKLSPVVATADGIVVNAGPKSGYGNCVIIKHANGVETLYGHLAKVSIQPGDRVCRGEQIGLVGSTGQSTGPHLHYEVRVNGSPRDPAPFIELAAFTRLFRQSEGS
ncbi:MAG: M23 family metallopeptidase [Bdellovibrionota bacterium]